MYGKIFEDIFDSSLMAQGGWLPTYIFMSMISMADKDGYVRKDQYALYSRLGLTRDEKISFDEFKTALHELESEDKNSNISRHAGRRIMPLSAMDDEPENRGWLIVNYIHYRNKASKVDRNVKRKMEMRKKRESEKDQQNHICPTLSHFVPLVPHTDVDLDLSPVEKEEPIEAPERDHRRDFISRFDGLLTFQTFDDTKAGRKNLTRVMHGSLDDLESKLESLNLDGAGIYMTVNETDGVSRKTESIKRVRAVFVDLDGGIEPDEVLKHNPHLLIESSPEKYHGYWLVADVPLEAFRGIQESIARKFGGDKAVKDLPRVMRVPGFMHRKCEPFMTKIIHSRGFYPLTYSELLDIFPPKREPKPRHYTGSSEGYKGQYKGQYGTGEGGRNNHLARRIGGMIKRGLGIDSIIDEALKEGFACSPPLDEREIMAIVNSCRRYS